MPFDVYVLQAARQKKIYIGFTSDLEARIKSHNELATKGWTIKFRPWNLVHVETFETKSEAMKREKELKSSRGRQFLRQHILPR